MGPNDGTDGGRWEDEIGSLYDNVPPEEPAEKEAEEEDEVEEEVEEED